MIVGLANKLSQVDMEGMVSKHVLPVLQSGMNRFA